MAYTVSLQRQAAKELAALPATVQKRIVKSLARLAENPQGAAQVVPLQGSPFYRLRVGDYRVVFAIDDDVLVVLVVKIGHRRDVYR